MGFPVWNAELGVNGVWMSIEECKEHDIELVSASRKNGSHLEYQMGCINRGREFRLDGFRWKYSGCNDDFGRKGCDLSVYLEGWSSASSCGTKRYDECNFSLKESHPGTPNIFSADYFTAIRDKALNKIILAGFITSADQFGRFTVKFSENGIDDWCAISSCDGITVGRDEVISSEVFAVFEGFDLYHMQCEYADIWGRRMKARNSADLPLGWCAGEFSGNAAIIKNSEHLPFKHVKLAERIAPASEYRQNETPAIPEGIAYLAEQIRQNGFSPVLRISPFLVPETSNLLKERPDFLLHDTDGYTLMQDDGKGGRAAVLDGTNPDVCNFLKEFFQDIRKNNFECIELDFISSAAGLPGKTVFHDKKATRAQALRRGFEAIRQGFGDEGFIIANSTPLGSAIGVADGVRISADIKKESPSGASGASSNIPDICSNIANRSYMHRRLWLNDPGILFAGEDEEQLEMAKLHLEALRLSGGILFSGDNLDRLDVDRISQLKELFSNPDVWELRTLDVWERTSPGVWLAINRQSCELRLALFNFTDSDCCFELEKHQLPPFCSDIDGSYIGKTATLPPKSCRIYNEVI